MRGREGMKSKMAQMFGAFRRDRYLAALVG